MNDWIDHTPPANDIPNSFDWCNYSQAEKNNVYVICVFLVISFLLRNTKWFGWMWRSFMLIIMALFIALFVDELKKGVKNWWNK